MSKLMTRYFMCLITTSLLFTPLENTFAKKTPEEREAARAEKKAKKEADKAAKEARAAEKKAQKKAECDSKGWEWKDTKKGKCKEPREEIWELKSNKCKKGKVKKGKIDNGLGVKYFNSDSECIDKLAVQCESKGKKVDTAKRKCAKDDNKKNCDNLAKQKKKASAEISSEIDGIIASGTCTKDQVKDFKKKVKEENKEKKNCDKLAKVKKDASPELSAEIDSIVATGSCTKDHIKDFKKKAKGDKKEKKTCDKISKLKKDATPEIASEIDEIVAAGNCTKDQHKEIKQKLKGTKKDKKLAEKQAKCEKKAGKKWDIERNKCVNDEEKLKDLQVFELNSRTGVCKQLKSKKAAKTVVDSIKFFPSDEACRASAGSIDDVVIFKKDKKGTCSRIEGAKALKQAKKIDNKKYFKTEAECTEGGGTVSAVIYIQKKNKCTSLEGVKAERHKAKSSSAGKFWEDKASCETALNESVAEEIFEFKKKIGGKRVCNKLSAKKAEKVKDQVGGGTYFKGLSSCEDALKNYLGSDADTKKCIDVFRKAYKDVFKKKKTDAQAVAFVKSKGCGK